MQRRGAVSAARMTLAPEKSMATSGQVNMAKKNALKANKAQWGITEALVITDAPAPSKLANMAKKNALEANKAQWGITEALKIDSAAVAPAMAAPAAAKSSGLNKAKTNTLQRNKEQWGITEALDVSKLEKAFAAPSAAPVSAAPVSAAPIAVPASIAPLAPAYRKVTNDEIRALLLKLSGMASEADMEPVLATLGYKGQLAANVISAIQSAKAGGMPLADYEKVLEEAMTLQTRSKASLTKAEKLEAQGRAAQKKIGDECEPKIRSLGEKLTAAEADQAQWGWVPFNTAAATIEAVKKQIEETKKQAADLNQEAKECEAGGVAMRGASINESEMADAKRIEAAELKAQTVGAEKQAALEALEIKLLSWEQMAKQGNVAGAVAGATSTEAKEMLFNLGLVPSVKAGVNSVSGRVYGVLTASKEGPKGKGAVASSSSSAMSSGEDSGNNMTRNVFIGLFGLALAGGAVGLSNPALLAQAQKSIPVASVSAPKPVVSAPKPAVSAPTAAVSARKPAQPVTTPTTAVFPPAN